MPETIFANNNVQILKATLIGWLFFIFLSSVTVIGMHHASGINSKIPTIPDITKAQQVIIISTFAATSKPDEELLVFVSLGLFAAQPQFGHTIASSHNSLPHLQQYFI